jgi:hypothetical protein
VGSPSLSEVFVGKPLGRSDHWSTQALPCCQRHLLAKDVFGTWASSDRTIALTGNTPGQDLGGLSPIDVACITQTLSKTKHLLAHAAVEGRVP